MKPANIFLSIKHVIGLLVRPSLPLLGFFALAACAVEGGKQDVADADPAPIHLDDIHFIVQDEEAAVAFFQENFGAREMAHPGERFGLVRFLSVKWQDPTITITKTGPYEDLPEERNARWRDATIITPQSELESPVYGPQWLALAAPDLAAARTALTAKGATFLSDQQALPMEPEARAFAIAGPDGARIVIVERPERDFAGSEYAVDHVQIMTPDLAASAQTYADIFAAQTGDETNDSIALQVADARIIVSKPEALGMKSESVGERSSDGTIRIGLDHLGFLYTDVSAAVASAQANGYEPLFPATRYVYRGKPTVYTFSGFEVPSGFTVEMVAADGRVGPHSYYIDEF